MRFDFTGLGGAAVIFAGAEMEYVKAIATIGAPSDTSHVLHIFKSDLNTIQKTGHSIEWPEYLAAYKADNSFNNNSPTFLLDLKLLF